MPSLWLEPGRLNLPEWLVLGLSQSVREGRRLVQAAHQAQSPAGHPLNPIVLGHDVRGPINAIHVCAALLINNGQSGDDELRYILEILKSCDRLNHMVRDIIDFTRGRFGEPMHLTRSRSDGTTCAGAVLGLLVAAVYPVSYASLRAGIGVGLIAAPTAPDGPL